MEESISKEDLVPQDIWISNGQEESLKESPAPNEAERSIGLGKPDYNKVSERTQTSKNFVASMKQDSQPKSQKKNEELNSSRSVEEIEKETSMDLEEVELKDSDLLDSISKTMDLKSDESLKMNNPVKVIRSSPKKLSETEIALQIIGFVSCFEIIRFFLFLFRML